MNNKRTGRIGPTLAIGAALFGAFSTGHAGSESHYNGGIMDIRDYIMPDQGLYGALYNYYYTSDRVNDGNGNQINSVTIKPGPGPGLTVNVSPSLDLYALVPAVIWVSPWQMAGIKYGAYIAPSFANASIAASLSDLQGRGVNASTSTMGVGDLFVEPIWLDYPLTNWDFGVAYGFYAPVGKYSTKTYPLPVVGPVTVESPDNIGLGFWTQQVQGSAAWYPWDDKRMAVVTALTYEYNSQKQGIDITPGQHLTLNWGVSEYLPLTKDEKLLLELGPAGYDDWQITDDSGSAARNTSVHDNVNAAGGQLGITYVPWMMALNFHAFYEYSSTGTFQGTSYGLNLVWKF